MTKIEMFLNIRIQSFFVQKIGVTGVSKYTFSEIALSEIYNFKIEKQDFIDNKIDD